MPLFFPLINSSPRCRAVFDWMSKIISELLWFCITSLSDWFKVLAPLFQPIKSESKTNRGSRVHIFPRFLSTTCNYFEFSLVYRPFWLAKVITLVLRHSIENRSNTENVEEKDEEDSTLIPFLSEYSNIDPATLWRAKFDPECLPPIEASDLLSYLVLDMSYYTAQQFKAFKGLKAYNQMVSGFITCVQGESYRRKVSGSHLPECEIRSVWMTRRSLFGWGWVGFGETCFHVASKRASLHWSMNKDQWKIGMHASQMQVAFAKVWEAQWPHGQTARLRIDCFGFESWPGTLRCVLGQDTLLSRCLSPPRCINGHRRNAGANPAID